MDDNALRERLSAVLGDGFQVEDLLGKGGCALVFSVQDLRLGREIAVKVLRPDLDAPINRERFRREAESVAKLRHPHIIHVHDIGEAGGITWFTMPRIRGESLRGWIDREGKLGIADAQRILAECARALDAAHVQGLVHRDIKPDNVLLDGPERSVVLTDFGLVKSLSLDDTGLTTNGMVVGTPHYMSPEQLAGDAPVEARSDLWSLGVMGYRMLAGVLPFEAKAVPMLVAKVLGEEPTPLSWRRPDVPPPLAEAIMRCLAKEPDGRWASASEFEQALTTIMAPRVVHRRSSVRRSSAVTLAAVEAAMATPLDGLPALPGEPTGGKRSHLRLAWWRRKMSRAAIMWLGGFVLAAITEFALSGRVLLANLLIAAGVIHEASLYAKAWLRGFGWRELAGLSEPAPQSRRRSGEADPLYGTEPADTPVVDDPAVGFLEAMQTDRRIIVALLLRTVRADLERAPDYRRSVDDAIHEADAIAEQVWKVDGDMIALQGRASQGRRGSFGRSSGRGGLPRVTTGAFRASVPGRAVPMSAHEEEMADLAQKRDDLLHVMRQGAEAVRALRLRLQSDGVPGSESYAEVVSGATQRMRMRAHELADSRAAQSA
ncbi:MAG: serine/threonine protein kinase [Gemmatimonadetes bacterium]|nr:serine/threonine protein kinase [Gemmatimonadota bacterium]